MASQSAILLHSRLPLQVHLPCLSSTRIRISAMAVPRPQPPLQPLSSGRRRGLWNSPTTTTTTARGTNVAAVKSPPPLVSPHDHLGNFAVLFSAGVLGVWSEETKIGRALSGALVATLLGFAANNLGIIASDASSFPIVMDFLLPLAVPLLLFRADLHRVFNPTDTLFPAFFLGSVGTIMGAVAAHLLVPMKSIYREMLRVKINRSRWSIFKSEKNFSCPLNRDPSLGYFHIYNIYNEASSIFGLGFGAQNVIRAVYFATLCALASRIPPETTTTTGNKGMDEEIEDNDNNNNKKLSTLHFVTSLAVSFSICKVGSDLSKRVEMQGGSLPVITMITVVLATILPEHFAWLAPSGEAMGMILMQVFFAVMGARENIRSALKFTPYILMYSLVEISVHLAITLGLGKLLRFDLKSLLIASNALVCEPSTACAIATTKGWSSMILPGVLSGFFGIPFGTFVSTLSIMTYSKYK